MDNHGHKANDVHNWRAMETKIFCRLQLPFGAPTFTKMASGSLAAIHHSSYADRVYVSLGTAGT